MVTVTVVAAFVFAKELTAENYEKDNQCANVKAEKSAVEKHQKNQDYPHDVTALKHVLATLAAATKKLS